MISMLHDAVLVDLMVVLCIMLTHCTLLIGLDWTPWSNHRKNI